MIPYAVYNQNGEILRSGICMKDTFDSKARNKDEQVMRGNVKNALVEKIEFYGIDRNGDPIPFIIEKTLEEIKLDKPPSKVVISYDDQRASITNREYQQLLDRITALEQR